MYISESKIKVRYAETDQMGVVYHSNYYIWFEVGRRDFIEKCGMSYGDVEKEGVIMPIVETYCKYHEGAKYDDDLVVQTYIEELSPIKVIFNYNVIREIDGKLLAKGKTTQTFVGKNFKIVNLKKNHPQLWESFNGLR